MIGNETGHLLNFVALRRKLSNISETQHMLRRDIVASMLKILCQIVNPVKSYSKTKMTVLVLSLWEKYRWGLTSFGQFISLKFWKLPFTENNVKPAFDCH